MDKNPEIKFLHFRLTDQNGVIAARGGLTVAYRAEAEGTLRYAGARCHTNDNFVKRQGRVKAAGRLNSASQSDIFTGSEQEFMEYLHEEVLSDLNSDLSARRPGMKMIRKYSGNKIAKQRVE